MKEGGGDGEEGGERERERRVRKERKEGLLREGAHKGSASIDDI